MKKYIQKYLSLLKNNWQYYQLGNPHKKWLLFNYIVWVLFYRRVLCPIIALPLLLVYFSLYPIIKIRFIRLIGSAIGHFATSTELLLCKIDTVKNDQFINVFYIEHSLYDTSIANQQLYKMWKRVIFILPLGLSGIANYLNKYITYFLAQKDYDLGGMKTCYENRWIRDVHAYLKTMKPHLSFTSAEHNIAKKELEKINLSLTDKYVCLLVRSAAYNKGHPTWNVPERNAELSTYLKACEFLAKKGYYVLRMGKVVDDYLVSSHPNVIDYARSPIRSDFMDIYLSAHCYFFISTGSGLDEIPQIFRRPVLYTNMLTATATATWWPHYLFITKKLFFKKTNRLLTFKEQEKFFFNYLAKRQSLHLAFFMEQDGIGFINNTEDEILAATEEMEKRVAGTWIETDEDKVLQNTFWDLYPKEAKTFNPLEKINHLPLYGKIAVKIGSQFLRDYEYLMS